MKLKLPVGYFALIGVLLNQMTIDNKSINEINFTSLAGLRAIFLKVVKKHAKTEPSKKVTAQIPEEFGRLFFNKFNKLPINGHENVVIKEICRQIKTQIKTQLKSNQLLIPY